MMPRKWIEMDDEEFRKMLYNPPGAYMGKADHKKHKTTVDCPVCDDGSSKRYKKIRQKQSRLKVKKELREAIKDKLSREEKDRTDKLVRRMKAEREFKEIF